jgi:hypothetical protein
MSRAITQASSTITTYAPDVLTNAHTPADAAYLKISISIGALAGTYATNLTADLCEVRVISGNPFIYLANKQTPAAAPGVLEYTINGLQSSIPFYTTAFGTEFADLRINTGGDAIFDDNVQVGINLSVLGDAKVTGAIGVDGRIYFDSTLTGPYIQQAGTNGRIISVASATSTDGVDLLASTASARSGILITKATTGQPTTTLNGTGATDAFADVLRNGGIAVDSTNNRGYFYSGGWKFAALTTPSDSRLKDEITEITGALDTLRQLVPVAFKWKAPEAHGRTDCVADDGKRLGFIADQVATTDLAHWVETLGVDEREAHLVDTTEVLAVNIPQNEMEALVVQALLDIDTRLKALEAR